MAGLGRKVFAAGEVLTAANVQGYLQDQVIQVYDDASDRTTVLGEAVTEGMVTYLKDVNTVQVYDGTAWKVVTSDPTLTSSAASTYTIEDTDAGQYLQFTAATTITLNVATAFASSQQVQIFADGASLSIVGDGTVTLSGAGLTGTGVSFVANDQFEIVGIVCLGTNQYRIIGNVTGAE